MRKAQHGLPTIPPLVFVLQILCSLIGKALGPRPGPFGILSLSLGWTLDEEVERNMAAFPVVERCLRSCSVAGTDSKKTHMRRKEEKLLPIILSGDENKDKTKENKHHPVKIVRM